MLCVHLPSLDNEYQVIILCITSYALRICLCKLLKCDTRIIPKDFQGKNQPIMSLFGLPTHIDALLCIDVKKDKQTNTLWHSQYQCTYTKTQIITPNYDVGIIHDVSLGKTVGVGRSVPKQGAQPSRTILYRKHLAVLLT